MADLEEQIEDTENLESEMSIVERRKRLHHLADEINRWIDEPKKSEIFLFLIIFILFDLRWF